MKKSDRKVRDIFSFLLQTVEIFQWASVFSSHRQGKSFLLAVCVNKWKEWMIVCFGFQFLERAVFDLSIPLSFSVLCLSISLSLFSLGPSPFLFSV